MKQTQIKNKIITERHLLSFVALAIIDVERSEYFVNTFKSRKALDVMKTQRKNKIITERLLTRSLDLGIIVDVNQTNIL